MPLKNIHAINERHEVVSSFFDQEEFSIRIEQILKSIGDLERLSSRIAIKKLTPREAVQLKRGIAMLAPLKSELAESNNKALQKMGDLINPCAQLLKILAEAISDDAPAVAAKGGGGSDSSSNVNITTNEGRGNSHIPPRISSKVDVWSAGIIFFQMLYGYRPYGEGKSQEHVWSENLIYRANQVEFPVDPKAPKVSEEAKELIRACLTRDQRYR
jgi:hypothetical protein